MNTLNLAAGGPVSTGGILSAPAGSVLPTDAATPFPAGWTPLGLVGEDGLAPGGERTLDDILDWNGDVVASLQNNHSASFAFTLLEVFNAEVLKTVFGDSNLTVTPATPQVAAPVITLGAAAATGGTFAAGTYFWKLTAIDANGETVGSNEVSAAVALNGTQVINWTAVAGATGYKLYRGTTAGGENRLITTITSGATVTFTDTGAVGTNSVVPLLNTTGKGKLYAITEDGSRLPRKSFGFDMRYISKKMRIVVPNGQVTTIEESPFVVSGLNSFAVTIQSYKDASGKKVYRYYDDGIAAA